MQITVFAEFKKNSCKSFVFTAVFQCLIDVIRNVQAKTFRAP